MEYILPVVIPTGIVLFCIGSIMVVRDKLSKRPTFRDTEKRYMKKELCEEIHKSVDEKLSCIPDIKETVILIKTTLDLHVKNNGN